MCIRDRFGDAVFVSKFVTHPLKRLIASMGRVEDGNFQKIEIIVGKDEIGQFKDRYNAIDVYKRQGWYPSG